ncbi:uncharacterized protein LOC114518013 [Dendronephthya gigantea]|uniref:uncharacterized protein LOC114518013 n=1 Tax=Dendronephthya gigantea TaxID=151771 RepID=UPI0010696D9F|nr:uncharacterized protein LOC114518013 [Dendronephthya gigantea]
MKTGVPSIFNFQTHLNSYSPVNIFQDWKIFIYLTLTVFILAHVESLDINSAVCRCARKSKFGKPFVVVWNSPTGGCHNNFSVHIELEKHGILTNSNQSWNGEVVTVFYNAQLGLYPYYRYEDEKLKYNTGLPQLVDLEEHLKKASEHIAEKIPEPMYSGLAVIDWEGWRPLWDTNFGKKRLYRLKSIELVKREGKLKNEREIEDEAKKRFESAGKRLMLETIKFAKQLRPRALWGFYGFPECLGNCSKENKMWNNKLIWLYKSSTALFPSIYLMDDLTDNNKYVSDRLKEAFRVSRMAAAPGFGNDLPVFPYLRPLYHYGAREFKMLNEDDLENAIGQAVNFGSAGLILWGNHYDEHTSREICLKYNDYVNNKLGPYITLRTEEQNACSREKCFSNGRCVEKSVALRRRRKRSCKTIFKYGSVFKIGNTTSAQKRILKQNTTVKYRSKKLFGKNTTAFAKENTTILNDTVGNLENLTSRRNLSQENSTGSDLLAYVDMLDSGPNKTKKTGDKDIYWNKNSVLGHKKKHKIDYNSIKKSLRWKNGSKVLEMFNGKTSNKSQTDDEEKSETEVNKTSTKGHHKQTSKRGYSARVREETAVRVPGVYIILITVTLGGALLMTIIYVAIYYTVNVRGRQRENNYDYESEDENPFSIEPNSPWWNDDDGSTEKLLKGKK